MMKRLPRESMRKQSGAVILTYEIYSILHRITAKIKLIPFLYRIFFFISPSVPLCSYLLGCTGFLNYLTFLLQCSSSFTVNSGYHFRSPFLPRSIYGMSCYLSPSPLRWGGGGDRRRLGAASPRSIPLVTAVVRFL